MSIRGSSATWLRKALLANDLAGAMAEASQLPRIGLADALSLCLLMLERDPRRYERGAARWAARFALERRVRLSDLALLTAALRSLQTEGWADGEVTIAALGRRHGLPEAAVRLKAWRQHFRSD